MTGLNVIIPANNEQNYIGPCLRALAEQDLDPQTIGGATIIVAANACTDATVAEAEKLRDPLEKTGWQFHLIELAEGGKLNAINRAEEVSKSKVTAYLDADVICEPSLMRLIFEVLDTDAPRYASGCLTVVPPKSWITQHFARIWARLPFMTTNVQGAGMFAVNRQGRARWGTFPDIIADDGYARLMFSPEERAKVEAGFHWPMVEGFSQLVKVRRRQDAGVRELEARFPEIMKNESKPQMTASDHFRLFASAPISYLVYVFVILVVKSGGQSDQGWDRGR